MTDTETALIYVQIQNAEREQHREIAFQLNAESMRMKHHRRVEAFGWILVGAASLLCIMGVIGS